MKRILTIALALLLALAAVMAVCRFCFREPVPEGPANEQVKAILERSDCLVCHSQEPDLPFYSSFPVIGKMMDKHVSAGTRFLDLGAEIADPDNFSEATLSKLDHAVSYNTMPLHSFRMIHWRSGFDKRERSLLASWIEEKRGSAEPIIPVASSVEHDAAKAAMGKRLFSDESLSLDGTISCATCHVLENGGADHADERVSEGIYGLKGGVNAPTVYNAEYNVLQFWNGRAADLVEQAAGPMTNPVEMGEQTVEQVVERLSADKALVKEFEALYPGEGLSAYTLCHAIAEFERTLITPDSRFDLYLKGDSDALSELEKKGYEEFKENSCAACHFGAAVGGRSFEYLDIYADYFGERSREIEYNSDDEGLKGFTSKDEDLHKFKVPILRNIALTAPYFHDGSFQTLDEAVRAMARYELGKKLSSAEVDSIVAFLHTLTGQNPHLTAAK
ncbi:MAG: cytochrome c peroxidase [Candidatus Cryptobacteroides sp.]|nr:cytochrome c peroxidase [Rikenellaceae bacterium]MDY5746509.1 cytochrome c peroxidase [Candidatus Cryptobacteroides sp.]